MPDISTLIPTARSFYAALDQDNTKAWWQENRATYDDVLKPGALALLEEMQGPLERITDGPVKTKLFRPHRDVRFSKDKTPYNAHLHLMWSPISDTAPAIFFGSSPDYLIVGVGIKTPEDAQNIARVADGA